MVASTGAAVALGGLVAGHIGAVIDARACAICADVADSVGIAVIA